MNITIDANGGFAAVSPDSQLAAMIRVEKTGLVQLWSQPAHKGRARLRLAFRPPTRPKGRIHAAPDQSHP